MTESLLLAVDLDGDGAHPAAWRFSGRPPGSVLTGAALRAAVGAASGFVLASFEDSPLPAGGTGPDQAGRLEAGTRAAFAATLAGDLGLAPVLNATTTEPFHLATQLASLDHASHGRAAWIVDGLSDLDVLATVGAEPLGGAAQRQEVADVIRTARLLWDSWQDDAVIKDVASGRYLDSGRVHHIDFSGATFSVKGPLITPRPPQGQIVVIARDHLRVDEHADIVLVAAADPEAVAARAQQTSSILTFADVEVILDLPGRPAAERLAELDDFTPWPSTGRLRHVGSVTGLLDLLSELRGVDGVRFLPAVQALDLPLLAEQVVPARGRVLPGRTLRERLGLPRPASRFASTTA
ncbi:LLM class flavin-dependent oxidoreductase [Kineosporia babensis]|uniref:LLM class flavin-dependent oxidoreductase n=1 Tax=Kineosporia babensis TaxID=499548 RepID=A0A9X1SY30_9ACTN|nr:LLM class flavin-dependent oxidoreductase [Kineosporia babensis]MCD5316661.1 LLM class flavin-dependent oxidoreductase [Kineosporia babensis]